jgi:UDP-2-acetamido-2,6-beta-L-arabino-hexul-4-ose reductase
MTGASGFLGKNMQIHLSGINNLELFTIAHQEGFETLPSQLEFDFILHFAGVNRSNDNKDFEIGNTDFTQSLIKYLESKKNRSKLIFASSIQAKNDTAYGKSKLACENLILDYSRRSGTEVSILRLPNVYGKWAKPNHNSVVATFASKLISGQEVEVFNEDTPVPFIYIDDLCINLLKIISGSDEVESLDQLSHTLTPRQILKSFSYFKRCNDIGLVPSITTKSESNLLSTFLSYLRNSDLKHATAPNSDSRGVFTEVVKIDHGSQTSIIKMSPHSTRGNHLHNSKIEKFFVISGDVEFTFRNPFDSEEYKMTCNGNSHSLILAIPGWWHSIENVGNSEALILVWANELFDSMKPDTFKWKW